jgi:hypothetical protein
MPDHSWYVTAELYARSLRIRSSVVVRLNHDPADVFRVTEMLLHRACHCIDVSELAQPALSVEDVPVEFSKNWKL